MKLSKSILKISPINYSNKSGWRASYRLSLVESSCCCSLPNKLLLSASSPPTLTPVPLKFWWSLELSPLWDPVLYICPFPSLEDDISSILLLKWLSHSSDTTALHIGHLAEVFIHSQIHRVWNLCFESHFKSYTSLLLTMVSLHNQQMSSNCWCLVDIWKTSSRLIICATLLLLLSSCSRSIDLEYAKIIKNIVIIIMSKTIVMTTKPSIHRKSIPMYIWTESSFKSWTWSKKWIIQKIDHGK